MDDQTRVESLDTLCHLSYNPLCVVLVERFIYALNVAVKVADWHVLHYDKVGLFILKAFDVLKYVCVVHFNKVINNFKLNELLIVFVETSLDFSLLDDLQGKLSL